MSSAIVACALLLPAAVRNWMRGLLLGVLAAGVVTATMYAFIHEDARRHGRELHPYCEAVVHRAQVCSRDPDHAATLRFERGPDSEATCRGLADDDTYERAARCAALPCDEFWTCASREVEAIPPE